MKTLKLLFITLFAGFAFTSCSVIIDDVDETFYVNLEDVVTGYDLWYIDYNKTVGNGDVPFLSKAFTISFINGRVYANNNLVGLGSTGNGYGIQVGNYNTHKGFLEVNHSIDGYFDFDIIQISIDRIKLRDNYNGVTYFLEGYQKHLFDYDKVFYDNIEYFLQEYKVWEKSFTSSAGIVNEFDNENYLKFTPENLTTFYSSQDKVGIAIANILWDYEGSYSVENYQGYDNLKHLTLNYGALGKEEFELTVVNDQKISLFHLSSGTTYEFRGRSYIQYMKDGISSEDVRIDGRKRTKISRETIVKT
ncbi:hypothetical protein [Lutibacter sp.]|uniref:hypothetical protein n=1 Tax=Lutibacter sp. TaxID=1925666 RepID=UPI0027331738|nr:hypothetical protein [Lutibacter sp.]MDP3313175.1 hypothetical protein [Lutibacter sp.]